MRVSKTWSQIQQKIRPSQALQDLTVLELFDAMGVSNKVIALNKWNITIEIQDDVISVILPSECEPKSFSDELRDRVINKLTERGMYAFGDGQEQEYLCGGTTFVGFYNMTDSELTEELEMYEDQNDDLVQECRAQLEVTKMLTDTETT